MRLSTRSRYGLRALLDIALHEDERPVMLREIAEREGISKPYLEQLILALQAAGFVRSIRGKKGGFVLAKAPSEIPLIEVIRALERTFSFVDCIDNPQTCPRNVHCVTKKLWHRLKEALERELTGLTLQDLMEWT